MPIPNNLFSDQDPAFAPQPDRLQVVAGKVVAVAAKPSAVQKRFNTLMARLDTQQALHAQLRQAIETHMPLHRQNLHDFDKQNEQIIKSMVCLLDAHLSAPQASKGLTPKQRQQATAQLLTLCLELQTLQDPEVEAIRARHSDPEDAQAAEQAEREAQAMLKDYLGLDDDFAQGREFDSTEDMLRAALAHEQAKRQAHQAKRDAKRAERKANKAPSARSQAAAQKEQDAQSALRTVFRQLASALHPDREPDAQLRARKTELMSEVNAAYERRDLSALLRIQLQTEWVDASKAAQLSQDKLKAMCDLLNEQVKALEADNASIRQAIALECGYPSYLPFDEAQLLQILAAQRKELEADLAAMQDDLASAQALAGLKAWLKQQTKAQKEQRREQSVFDLSLDDVLSDLMRTT